MVSGEKFQLLSFQLNEKEIRQESAVEAEDAGDEERRRNVEKWEKERKLLIDVFTVKKPTGKSKSGKKFAYPLELGADDFGYTFGQKSWDQDMKFYLEPGHKRPGLKWVQTTNETKHIFNTFRLGDHLRGLAKKAREERSENANAREENRTELLWAPRIPIAESYKEGDQQSPDTVLHQKLDEFVTKKLQELYGHDFRSEEGEEQAQNEIDCDPDARCATY